ncbi:MAG TPA: DUF177 domain-containing protein [Solirubrobacteraceae bacterium]|jgi:uncharacterized protein|nr:DUF177 domain-containing protein [Solirubrobacteraceae bacterium]
MSSLVDTFDLNALRLASGEGRRLDLDVRVQPFDLGGDTYSVEPAVVPVRLDISRTSGPGYALRLRFGATLQGACMRCLEPADASYEVDAREVSQPGAGEELDSPYVKEGVLDVAAWTRDALALTFPRAILCREDCAGLCPVCGETLNAADADHHHEASPDPRWAKLSELKFDA